MQAPARHVAPLGHYCCVNIRPVEILGGRIKYLVFTFSTIIAVSLKVGTGAITGWERAISTDARACVTDGSAWALKTRAVSL